MGEHRRRVGQVRPWPPGETQLRSLGRGLLTDNRFGHHEFSGCVLGLEQRLELLGGQGRFEASVVAARSPSIPPKPSTREGAM